MHRLLLITGTVLAMTPAVSCGGRDSGETGLTKKEFVKRANAICDAAEREKINSVVAYLKKNPGVGERKMVKPLLLPPLESQIQELKVLSPPERDEAAVQTIVMGYEDVAKLMRTNPEHFISMKVSPFKEADRLAVEYELVGCDVSP